MPLKHSIQRLLSNAGFTLLVILLLPNVILAQLFEDFETGSKGTYISALVDFDSGNWLLDDSLIGKSAGDRFFDSQSIRLRDGFIQMEFNYSEGADIFSFYGANSGFANDTGGAVQVFYSIDNGSLWSEVGDLIELTESNSLEYYEVSVNVAEPIRFKIERVSGNRVNIDNVHISPYLEPSELPELFIRISGNEIADSNTIQIPASNVNTTSTITLTIGNRGLTDLEIKSVDWIDGEKFEIDKQIIGSYGAGETKKIDVIFSSIEKGLFTDSLIFATNDPLKSERLIVFETLVIDEFVTISVKQARELPFGVRARVEGIVTVSDEFDGPSFIQDESGGIAVFSTQFKTTVNIGDSVWVSGPISEYNPVNGTQGRYSIQIGPYGGDDLVNYEILQTNVRILEPTQATVSQKRSGEFEGRLVLIKNVIVKTDGNYSAGAIYEISDRTGAGKLSISESISEFEALEISQNPVHIVGVIDRFDGVHRLNPRSLIDINVFEKEYTGEDIPTTETFDVVTWNIEWFGATFNGPPDPIAQMNNVIKVINTIDADLYALQEIADSYKFYALIDSLESYSGFLAPYSQAQKTAYLFKTSVIDSISSGLLEEGQSSFDWGGRLPLSFSFDATVAGETRRIHTYNIHAKAFGDEPSYLRRRDAAHSIRQYFNKFRRSDNVIFLGDFNDQLNFSTYNEEESPYSVFLDDEKYLAVSKTLEDEGFSSYLSAKFRSFIDHTFVKNNLIEYHINGSQRVANVDYIHNFETTTSDHAPVWSRFQFTEGGNGPTLVIPESFTVNPNFPNPFNPSTTISFSIPESDLVTITIYDVLGRKVATILEGSFFESGRHYVPFDAGDLSSGIYLYRVTLQYGESITMQMMYIK